MSGDAFRDHSNRSGRGFTPGNMSCDRQPRVVVDELEDHELATPSENVVRPVQLPARVRRGIDEPPIRGPRFFPRLKPGNARVAEDPRQRRNRGHRFHPERPHLLVNTDRSMIPTGMALSSRTLPCTARRRIHLGRRELDPSDWVRDVPNERIGARDWSP